MKGLREIVLIHDLKKQGLSISAIARKVGCVCKTVCRHLERGLEAPVYGARTPRDRIIEPCERYLQERVQAFPDLSGARQLRKVRPAKQTQFERRFETLPGKQTQVDFAEFTVEFSDDPGVVRKVWLISMVLGQPDDMRRPMNLAFSLTYLSSRMRANQRNQGQFGQESDMKSVTSDR
ncbi:hypothetical protein SAMN05444959_110106 [Paracoccus seriniphilus]|uniref:Transposase IS30-like HTH domain-containing protein n=1 Tax=Paracoccus seriniphilus TaxID=184748 RepID=A0A239PYC0_9RHOB|nr:hypothetical protein SAMN05444959_110106 [Paracoccus seriniphilus]